MDIWKRFGEKEVSHSMAHYLQAVASLKTEKGHARGGDIATHLGVSKSGVTSMLRSLQTRGLISHEKYGSVELPANGLRLAERTESSRLVITRFLTEILGVAEHVASEDACMIEHLVSPEVSVELLKLTSFMRSEHPAARQFLLAYRATPHNCTDHSPESCAVCQTSCLRDSLVRDIGTPSARAEA